MAQPNYPVTGRGFNLKNTVPLDKRRITALSVTSHENILMCDYDNNMLILCDLDGTILHTLGLDSSPWDVAVSVKNKAYVTLPNVDTVLLVDPERLCIFSRQTIPGIVCVSASKREDKVYFGCNNKNQCTNIMIADGMLCETGDMVCTKMALKYHVTCEEGITHFRCIAGENSISINSEYIPSNNLLVPSDICSDDFGHIYICGQMSHNIVRFKDDGTLIDIPTDINRNGIYEPVAMCFNSSYHRFFVVDRFGSRIHIFETDIKAFKIKA